MPSYSSFITITFFTTTIISMYSMELNYNAKTDRAINKTIKRQKNGSKYAYLSSNAFQKRHIAAAAWVKNSPLIIEIGGGNNSMASRCTENQKIIVIDPAIQKKETERITYIPAKFENWQGSEDIYSQRYSVVILGLALNNMPDHGWNKLYKLINHSECAVIEYSTTYKNGKQQVKGIIKNTDINKQIINEQDFNFSQEAEFKSGIYSKVNPYRKMIVLANK